ncbi:putative sporulation protein RMD8 [Blumeria hordei DH14]|uniref:Putative sporulation protein RMD8 n=1 Tax=Blumeria graminis f. sp. hordei (strain DH14) TaxID=546991 RepID=N1JF99_BLUG1|nr:putative sporulation protein RMD8 [Blumeria hordei DH14]
MDDLPPEVYFHILQYLDPIDTVNLQQVNHCLLFSSLVHYLLRQSSIVYKSSSNVNESSNLCSVIKVPSKYELQNLASLLLSENDELHSNLNNSQAAEKLKNRIQILAKWSFIDPLWRMTWTGEADNEEKEKEKKYLGSNHVESTVEAVLEENETCASQVKEIGEDPIQSALPISLTDNKASATEKSPQCVPEGPPSKPTRALPQVLPKIQSKMNLPRIYSPRILAQSSPTNYSPRTRSPLFKSPLAKSPQNSLPYFNSFRAVSPRLASLKISSPKAVSPHTSSPRNASPRLISPKFLTQRSLTMRRTSEDSSMNSKIAPYRVPTRTTKVCEKLMMLPDTHEEANGHDENDRMPFGQIYRDEESKPLNDEEWDVLKKRGGIRGKSYAERLPKAKRAKELARVTAYCTAQSYWLCTASNFIRFTHGARTKLYDDCLYSVYDLPLLSGKKPYKIQSGQIIDDSSKKELYGDFIEPKERGDYQEGYFENTDEYSIRKFEENPRRKSRVEFYQSGEEKGTPLQYRRKNSVDSGAVDGTKLAELFIFSYGVIVFWNFTEQQEKDILADLALYENENVTPIASRPLEPDNYEKEDFHFEYSHLVDRPRVFNDMITLRSGDHLIKLTISHAIAQSTKLCMFEESMNQTMANAQHVPKHLALTGKLGMTRSQIFKIMGTLFKTRVETNGAIASKILDIPNFFWNSEPTLHPLYTAIRDYLEIPPRIKILNERCKVFLDLAEILSNSIACTKMVFITWIVIFLIMISIGVTVTECLIRVTVVEK